jgi:hypothetical protein
MRDNDVQQVVDGLTAIAMMDRERMDFRDMLVAMSLLHHAAVVIGADPADLFERVAVLAEPSTSDLMLGFLKRSPEGRDIQQSWGYTAVETDAGPGFVGWGFKAYRSTYPLDRIAFALEELLRQDKYLPTDVTLATDLPAVWLSSGDASALGSALAAIRAVVTVGGQLRAAGSRTSPEQMLLIFLVEVSDEAAAASLMRLAEAKEKRSADVAMAAAREGRVFCLAVEESTVQGGSPIETATSMQRFSRGMSEVLKRYVPS